MFLSFSHSYWRPSRTFAYPFISTPYTSHRTYCLLINRTGIWGVLNIMIKLNETLLKITPPLPTTFFFLYTFISFISLCYIRDTKCISLYFIILELVFHLWLQTTCCSKVLLHSKSKNKIILSSRCIDEVNFGIGAKVINSDELRFNIWL